MWIRLEVEARRRRRPFATIASSTTRHLANVVMVASIASSVLIACAPRNEMHPPREPVLSTHANATEPTPRARDHEILAEAGSPSSGGQVGLASWYGSELAGKRTANGETFDPRLYTAAHKQLPFGTWVEVRRLDTGSTVRVRINDRGPNGRARGRLIDLSRRAAEALGLVRDGVARVEVRVVDGP